METGLKGKVVIVMGGSSTIGRGIVLAFAKEGSKVVIADWDEPQGQKTASKAKELGAEGTLVIKTDVTHVDEVDNMVKTVLKKFGTIDVLVNDVGRPYDKYLPEETKELLDEEIATNLISTVNGTKAVLPHMIQAGKGNIVNIGSEAGRMGDPERVIYSACKGGVIAFTKAVARSVGHQGIRVNCVCPNTIMPTSMEEIGEGSIFHPVKGMMGIAGRTNNPRYMKAHETALANHAIARMGTPSDIAPAVVFLASEGASYITGQTLSVNGGNTMI
jgi:2-hydroxycyclohexanecarboxyl-CoA dehydrogenase